MKQFLTVLLFVVGAVGLWFGSLWLADRVSDATLDRLERAATLVGLIGSSLAVGTAFAGFYRRRDIARFVRRARGGEFPAAGEEIAEYRDRADALVIPVSRKEQPLWLIYHLKPKFVSFLYTDRSRETAAEIAAQYSREMTFLPDAQQIRGGIHALQDPNDLHETRALAGLYLDQLLGKGISRSRILVDATGGTVAMSLGCFQAAEQRRIASIYLKGREEVTAGGWKEMYIQNPHLPEAGQPIYLSRPAAEPGEPA